MIESSYVSSCCDLSVPAQVNQDSSVFSLLVYQNDQIFVCHETGCYITKLETSTEEEIELFRNQEVQSICSPEENIICIANQNTIHLFDTRVGFCEQIVKFSENTDEINQIKCSYNDNHLIACDDAGECKIFDLKMRKIYRTLRRKHKNICSTATYLPNKPDEVITGGLDSQIILWDTKRVKPLQFVNTQELLKRLGDDSVYMFNPPIVHSIDVSNDGQYLAAGLGNGTLQIFNVMRGKFTLAPSLLLNKHSSLGVSCTHFTKNFKLKRDDPVLLTGGNDGMINIWSFPLIQPKKKQVIPTNTVYADEELDTFLVSSFDMKSKVNCVESACINDKCLTFVGDQTAKVKCLEIKPE